ncbi:ABC transporter permease [Agrobacterium larrymoorei]|uniref:ABC transporter permease n=1 Tax=Agrobacterium larrymoorei TaxID=160699 RepID=A0AAF0HAK9_9HYPH|nr:ABC transporter permease [Agrobacterium larrymoorei]WHA43519.1 ABC transporter permease [Agrobacterium larrymoorei]
MADDLIRSAPVLPASPGRAGPFLELAARRGEPLAITLLAVFAGMGLFSLFLLALGKSPVQFLQLIYTGGFGSWFSLQNTMSRAAPLLLTALCVALPARLGLIIIGGEGALVLGGLAASAASLPLVGHVGNWSLWVAMAAAGMMIGGLWIGLAGALKHRRGVNETISSLLLTYIGIAIINHLIEGPLRDPASLNKPSTAPLPGEAMIGKMPGMDVHWGFGVGIIACVLAFILMERTTIGFAARIAGGNIRGAQVQGLPVGRLIIGFTFLAGALAGLAGMLEVAAVQGSANGALVAGYGYTGILVAFLARQNPLAIIPVAVLLGGITAAGGLIQRRLGLPDASVLVLQGTLFIAVLFCETLYGRFKMFNPELWATNRMAREAR